MADVEEGKPTDGPNEYDNMNESAQQDELKEVKAHLISANGGAGGDTSDPAEYKVAIVEPSSSSDGEVSFSGLGKDEVLKYANDPFWVRLRWILFILFWVGWIAMLVTAITIIVLAPRCPPRPDLKWYNTDTVYQVVVKSFKDSSNDGYGDFKGLTDKLSYITDDIGAKAIWLDSIYKYDGEDYSLGILDHKDLDDKLEVKLDDFKNWLKKMRKEGKKIILDLIPNQSSKNHSWFLKSKLNDSHFADYYIWQSGSPNNPPGTQKNKYGDSAWSYDSERKAWYFHQYSKDYPDLNLKSEAVKKEFKDILKFWFEAGVSGFHIKGLESAYNNDTLAFLEALRVVADEYSDKPGREKLLFGSVRNGQDISEYWGTNEKKRLHIVVPVMEELKDGCKAVCAKALVEKLNINVTNYWPGLQLGNQETQRVATRLGGDYKKRLMQAHALQLLLLGTPFNYYGDEFGQRDGDAQTSVKFHGNEVHMTPMQWNTLVNAGFTDKNVSTWIPVGSNYKVDNVQVGLAHFSGLTPLEAYMQLSKLRTRESFQWGTTKVSAPNEDLLVFTRQASRFPYFLVLMNLSDQEIHVSPEDLSEFSIKEGTVRYHTQMEQVDKSISFLDKGANLRGYDVIVLELPALD